MSGFRAKEVDLVPYLTTHLVDDFASHIRLYRRALDKMNLLKLDSTKPPPDLEAIFFDLECEMERTICRDLVCTSEEHELRKNNKTTYFVDSCFESGISMTTCTCICHYLLIQTFVFTRSASVLFCACAYCC